MAKADYTCTRPYACGETYKDVELLLYDTCHQFRREHGRYLDLDELMSDARIAYMNAYATWTTKSGCSFPAYVRMKVWMQLLEVYRTSRHKNQHKPIGPGIPSNTAHPEAGSWSKVEFFDGLSPDAQAVATLALEPSLEVIMNRVVRKDRNWRKAIAEHLEDQGWDDSRISSSFSEVADALNGVQARYQDDTLQSYHA